MSFAIFQRLLRWIFALWLGLSIFVLLIGMSAGPHAGGKVAMQMFILCLPGSVPVGMLLSFYNYVPPFPSSSAHIFFVWIPFFVGGLFQTALVSTALRRLGKINS